MIRMDHWFGRTTRLCALAGVAAMLVSVPAVAQAPDFGIGTPLDASGTGVTAAPALEAIKLASGLTATLVSDKEGYAPDMIALWPDASAPTHAIVCNEEFPEGVDQASVQLVDLSTGDVTDMLTGMSSCDPAKTTPWGTVLVGEEEDDIGRVIEILDPLHTTGITYDPAAGTTSDPSKAAVRTALGQLAFEGIVITDDGSVYFGDERRPLAGAPGGGIYKFVPSKPATAGTTITDLADSPLTAGSVWVSRLGTRANGDPAVPNQDFGQGTETGAGVWVPLETPADPATFNLDEAAVAAGMTGYYRPEDMARDPKYDGLRVCWNNTGNDGADHWGETMCLVDEPSDDATANPAGSYPVVSRFLEGNPEMRMPDNIDFDPTTGNMWINLDATTSSADDPTHPNDDVWVCLPDGDDADTQSDGCARAVTLLDGGAEFTGITFLADGSGFYQHLQHRTQEGDATPGTSDLIKVEFAH